VGLGDLAERPIGALSGGQLQRALIARALACTPKLLVLDEPTVGIDAAGQAQFAELLTTVHQQLGLTLLIVSHDLRAIAAGCDRVACLSCRLHSHTSPQGLTPAVLAELFSHDVAGLAGIGAVGGAGAGLAGMHIHAHGPDEPCPVEHISAFAAAHSVPVQLGITAKPKAPGAGGAGGAGSSSGGQQS
jgi:zinc transport system ATP-binding protein